MILTQRLAYICEKVRRRLEHTSSQSSNVFKHSYCFSIATHTSFKMPLLKKATYQLGVILARCLSRRRPPMTFWPVQNSFGFESCYNKRAPKPCFAFYFCHNKISVFWGCLRKCAFCSHNGNSSVASKLTKIKIFRCSFAVCISLLRDRKVKMQLGGGSNRILFLKNV